MLNFFFFCVCSVNTQSMTGMKQLESEWSCRYAAGLVMIH